MYKKWLSIIVVFLGLISLAQDEVSFTTEVSKSTLAFNERLRVEFKMNVDGDDFTPPNFQNFKVVGGPSQSVSQIWRNGRSTFNKSYTYVLTPNKKGTLTIGQASITHAGKTYKTIPRQIEVTESVENPLGPDDERLDTSDNLFLVAEVGKSNPYVNEGVLVTYKLYVDGNTGVTNLREIESPKYADFWSQKLDRENTGVRKGQYKGKEYRYVIWRETILYPQKSGKLELEPLTLNVDVEVPTNRRDFFGRRQYRKEERTVTAGKRTIDVKPLPKSGKPDTFQGAVGKFDIAVNLSKAELEAGESLTAGVQIKGSGNIKLLTVPQLKVPNGLELYDPERKQNIAVGPSGMRGSITDEYTIVPQGGGDYIIPPITFSYFNPETGQYVTKSSGEYLISVDGAPLSTSVPAAKPGTSQVSIPANTSFAFIKTDTEFVPREKDYFFGSAGFWGSVGGILLLVPIALVVKRRKDARAADVSGARRRRADKLSRQFLAEAKKSKDDPKEFYVKLDRALHNFLKARLGIQTADMVKDNVRKLLQEKGADQETSNAFLKLLERCEMARYASLNVTDTETDLKKAGETIQKLDKELK